MLLLENVKASCLFIYLSQHLAAPIFIVMCSFIFTWANKLENIIFIKCNSIRFGCFYTQSGFSLGSHQGWCHAGCFVYLVYYDFHLKPTKKEQKVNDKGLTKRPRCFIVIVFYFFKLRITFLLITSNPLSGFRLKVIHQGPCLAAFTFIHLCFIVMWGRSWNQTSLQWCVQGHAIVSGCQGCI